MEESKDDDDDLFFAPVAPFGEPRAAANAAANFTPEMLSDNGKKTGSANGKKSGKRILLIKIATGETFEFPSAHEAARVLGLDRRNLCHVARSEGRQHKGYAAFYVK